MVDRAAMECAVSIIDDAKAGLVAIAAAEFKRKALAIVVAFAVAWATIGKGSK